MKLSKAILILNELRKKHGDVEILVEDDNNGGYKDFNPYFDADAACIPDQYALDPNAVNKHTGINCVVV